MSSSYFDRSSVLPLPGDDQSSSSFASTFSFPIPPNDFTSSFPLPPTHPEHPFNNPEAYHPAGHRITHEVDIYVDQHCHCMRYPYPHNHHHHEQDHHSRHLRRHHRRDRPSGDGSVISPLSHPPPHAANLRSLPNSFPPKYLPEYNNTLFSTPEFLHIYLSPGPLGILTTISSSSGNNPSTLLSTAAYTNPDLVRPLIILHPGRDYLTLISRIGHAIKSANPPAWGISDLPPVTWSGWGLKLFLPRGGARIMRDLWEVVGDRIWHLEVRLVPPEKDIARAGSWWCTTSEQVRLLEGLRGDEEVEMWGRLKGVHEEVEELREREEREKKEEKERRENEAKEKEKKEKEEKEKEWTEREQKEEGEGRKREEEENAEEFIVWVEQDGASEDKQ